MSAKTNDTLYLAAGGFVLLGTCVWAFLQQSDIASFQEQVTAPMSGRLYESQPLTLTSAESKQWAPAQSQAAGENWLFDVFTPPVIYYNTETKRFTVTVPVITPKKEEEEIVVKQQVVPSFGLQIVRVVQPLFRLQLVGYIGEGPTARGNFENEITGEVIFGAAGKKIPSLNLEIVSFSAERVRTKVDGGTEIVETIAKATVRDTVTGEIIPLDAKVRRPEGPLTVTLLKADGTEVVAKSGDVITTEDNQFIVGELTVNPPSAVVTKSGGDLAAPETQTLVIPPPAPPVIAPTDGMSGENTTPLTGF